MVLSSLLVVRRSEIEIPGRNPIRHSHQGGRQPFDPFPGDGGYTGPILLNGNEKRDADASLVEARGLTNHLPLPGPIQWNFNDKREAIVYHPGFLDLPGSKPWNGPQLAGGPQKRNQRAWIQPYPGSLLGGAGRVPDDGILRLAGNEKRQAGAPTQGLFSPPVLPPVTKGTRYPISEKRQAITKGYISPPVLPPVTEGPRRSISEKRQEDMEAAVAAEQKAAETFPGYRARVPPPRNGIEMAACGIYIGRC